jgi:penicillin-binding protein 1A
LLPAGAGNAAAAANADVNAGNGAAPNAAAAGALADDDSAPVAAACRLPRARVAPRAISPQNAWLMDSMMADVITRGTGRRAMALGRGDLGGKTGTTNDAKDTWFNGFNRHLVATVWVGFDQERSLGEGEEGSRTAVPIWVHFMREALRGVPQRPRSMPQGLVQVRISGTTGGIASVDDPEAIFETFMVDRMPTAGVLGEGDGSGTTPATNGNDGASNPANPNAGADPLF